MKKILTKIVNNALRKSGRQIVSTSLLVGNDKYLDRNEFRYILWLDRIYQKIGNVPGHIIELGVAKGRNSILFGNLIQMNGDEDVRKYYGFDTFSGYAQDDLEDSTWLHSSAWKDNSYGYVSDRISRAGYTKNCKLIAGDLKKTLPDFIQKGMDGFTPNNLRVALLYVDCNAYLPAITGMNLLKDYMAPGGVICIDEKQQGGETKALIEFCEKNGLRYMKDASPFAIPAYTTVNG